MACVHPPALLASGVMARALPWWLVAWWLVVAALGLTTTVAARQPRTIKLRSPRFTVPAGGNVETCVFVRRPASAAFDLGSFTIRHQGTRADVSPRHFLVYVYTGERLAEFAQDAGQIVQSRACLDLGPEDRDHRQLIASGAGAKSAGGLLPGLALPLAPVPATPGGSPDGIGILLDAEWVNGSTKARVVSSRVVLKRARGIVRRRLAPILERTAELGLSVPPFSPTVVSTETTTAALNAARPGQPPLLDAWGPGIATVGDPGPAGDACVVFVTGHMHKRTRFIGVDLIGADGMVHNPPGGLANPFAPGRTHLFAAPDYTDPGRLTLLPAMLLRAGERLHYACWVDNGTSTAVRFGCEETTAVPPGAAAGLPGGGPAKPCTAAGPDPSECPAADAAYPGRSFTGRCVPANLVAGTTPDDEVCALAGFWFDAIPGAPAGSECNVAAAP